MTDGARPTMKTGDLKSSEAAVDGKQLRPTMSGAVVMPSGGDLFAHTSQEITDFINRRGSDESTDGSLSDLKNRTEGEKP
jgi:hypothetical protein